MIRPTLIFICIWALNLPLMAQDNTLAGPAGTSIYYQVDKKIFPCKWRNNRTRPEFSSIDAKDIPGMQAILNTALDKYPENVLRKNLKRIYVLKTMFFFGLEFGGTYYKRKVYITNNGIENGYTDEYIEGTFHHEFSSVLLKRHKRYIDKKAWSIANPPGFEYGDGGLEALRTEKTSIKLDSTLFANGFLNEYSLASFEEDFNCYAEFIFLSDAGFWEAWGNNEAIQKKTAILIRFYQRFDPIYTLEYFRSL